VLFTLRTSTNANLRAENVTATKSTTLIWQEDSTVNYYNYVNNRQALPYNNIKFQSRPSLQHGLWW